MFRLKTLLNLLAYLASVLCVAPLFPYLDRPVQAFWPAALLAGILCDRLDYYPLRRVPAAVLSCFLFIVYAVGINREQAVHSVVHILILLLAIRLVTEKSGRNYLQLFILSVFALAGSTLLDLSALFLLCLILLVFAVTVGLVLLTFHAADPNLRLSAQDLRRILPTALLLPAVSLVLMLGFFIILPRTSHPLWNFLNPTPATAAITGVSDRVQPGAFASLEGSGAVAFRAEGEELPPEELYWRGTVLNAMDGNNWERKGGQQTEKTRLVGGRAVSQTIYPELKTDQLLVALDPPAGLEGIRHGASADLVLTARHPLDQRTRYVAVSRPGAKLAVTGALDRPFYLQQPAVISPRLRAVAEKIIVQGQTEAERVELLKTFFREQKLSYATTDLPSAKAPLEEFLFDKKRGYCEFFASSFALLLRLADVPARLVGGYYGGEYNVLAGYYLVRESAAHVWVEAFVGGAWVRIDPSRLAQNSGAFVRPAFSSWQQLLDSLDYYWTQAVITYDLGRQIQLLQYADLELRDLHLPTAPGRNWLVPGSVLLIAAALYLRHWGRCEKRLLMRLAPARAESLRPTGAGAVARPSGTGRNDRRPSVPGVCRDLHRRRVSRPAFVPAGATAVAAVAAADRQSIGER